MFKEILVEKEAGFAKVIMNKPEAKNSITPRLMNELCQAFSELDQDDSVNVIFLMGAGDDFCAGMDLKFALDCLENDPEVLRQELIPLGPKLDDLIESMATPVISVVQGHAIAGGFILSYFCDLCIAADNAVFGDAHAKWGFVPGWQEPQRLARSIGIRRAKQFFLTGEMVRAQEAKDIGLVWKVVPLDQLAETVNAWGKKYSKMNSIALARMKQQLSMNMQAEWPLIMEQDVDMRKDLIGGFCTEEAATRLKDFGKK